MRRRRVTSRNPLKHLTIAEIRGIARLATEATEGVTGIAEDVQESVRNPLRRQGGKPLRRTRGITGLVYRSVYGATRLVGRAVDSVLAVAHSRSDRADSVRPESRGREAVLAALNGVMGDRLVAGNNPLAIPMTIRYRSKALNWRDLPPMPEATGKVLLMIHGLCMNDLQWDVQEGVQNDSQTFNHADILASEYGYSPVYLRYNSGVHTSQNGRELATHLEQMAASWPTRFEELAVIAHSMGGLLIRSAYQYAGQENMLWPDRLKSIVFLGTPHHGAPLERAGNWVDVILERTRYTAPFARMGRLRSAGITDLRYGNVLDDDWSGSDRFARKPDRRQGVSLPEGVACYTVAASRASRRSTMADRLTGDGLVPLNSALGQHDDLQRTLQFAEKAQWIAYQTNHLELLSSPDVTRQIVQWLAPVNA